MKAKNKAKGLKFIKSNEYEKVSKFLSKDNEQEIQSLYKLIDEMNSSGGTAHSFNGGKEQSTQQAKSNQAQENNAQSQTQTKPNEKTNDKAQTQEITQNLQNNLNQKMKQTGFTIKR